MNRIEVAQAVRADHDRRAVEREAYGDRASNHVLLELAKRDATSLFSAITV